MTSHRFVLLASFVLLAALARLVPHPPNFSPVGAMAVFGGACLADRRLALLLPLAALFVSDLVIGFSPLTPVVYGSFALSVGLGRLLRPRRAAGTTAAVTLAGSVQFFAVTNFACWVLYYPHTADGFAACYVSAVPFFENTLLGDAAFAAVLFGGLAVAERVAPAVREPATV